MKCRVCPRGCVLKEGDVGVCGARRNRGGRIEAESYGVLTARALDPIEKKPLGKFFPGSTILSVGSYGCNLFCPFCQNHHIARMRAPGHFIRMSPAELVDEAESYKERGNIGLAYTYNEPLIAYEFVRDCSLLIREKGMKNVVVTNGYVCQDPLEELLPLVDAWNIDLKSFNDDVYREIGGDLSTVKETISCAASVSHVEVTTLVIPGINDTKEEMRALSQWLASVNPSIPLHISRFFPTYKMNDRNPTPVETIRSLVQVAEEVLETVYAGNI